MININHKHFPLTGGNADPFPSITPQTGNTAAEQSCQVLIVVPQSLQLLEDQLAMD